jgi:hypothetical protein
MKTPASRARALASAAVAAGLCLAGTTGLTAPSQAAPGSCDTAYPVGDLTSGQLVHGLTVTQGVDPSPFNGTVIGVLADGIEPGVDMVMVQLSSPTITQVGGIWEGMSGSPVYAADGSLIGAVAYTLSYGATPVAGVTPWQDMQQYAGGPPPAPVHVPVSAATARRIAAATDVTTTQASAGFRELRTPLVLAGLGPRALAKATGRPYLSSQVSAAGRTDAATSPSAATMVAGGNLVATESTGDIVFAGLGTITSVCLGRVVGFGHPMEFRGSSGYGMAGADALYIQADSLGSPFKVANLGGLLGTVDQDRQTGISGPLGPLPPSLPITSTVTYTPDGGVARSRTGESDVQLPDATAAVTFYELMTNHQKVLDAYQRGSEDQSWTVHGHTASGPFTFTGGNRYTDPFDIAFGSTFDLPDLVYLLSGLAGVTVDSVDVTSHVVDSTATLKLHGFEQRRGGTWHAVDRTHPADFRAGRTAVLRVTFADGTHGAAFRLAVPARAAGMKGRLSASEAVPFPFEQEVPSTLGGVARLVAGAQRNDEAQIELLAFGDRGKPVDLTTATASAGLVIHGSAALRFRVR